MIKLEKLANFRGDSPLHQSMIERDDVIVMSAVFNKITIPYMPRFHIEADEDESAKLLQNVLSSTEKKWIDYQDVIAPFFSDPSKLYIVCIAANAIIWQYYVKFVDQVNDRFRVMYQPPEPEEVKPLDLEALEQLKGFASANRAHQAERFDQFKTAFNAFVQSAPKSTLEDKKKLGEWINAEVAQYGLAVECPNNPGLAVEVKGDTGNRPRVGRFQFLPLEGGDGRKQRVYREVLPELNFVPLVNTVDLSPTAKPKADQIER